MAFVNKRVIFFFSDRWISSIRIKMFASAVYSFSLRTVDKRHKASVVCKNPCSKPKPTAHSETTAVCSRFPATQGPPHPCTFLVALRPNGSPNPDPSNLLLGTTWPSLSSCCVCFCFMQWDSVWMQCFSTFTYKVFNCRKQTESTMDGQRLTKARDAAWTAAHLLTGPKLVCCLVSQL